MIVAKVIGTVVATRKVSKLSGYKLLLVQPLNLEKEPEGKPLVAVDAVGSGAGEIVLLVSGSSARLAVEEEGVPIDAGIIGIIDRWDRT